MLNTVLHHVVLSWIISSIKQMKYDIKENHLTDWLNKVPWYNTSICYKWHGAVFDDFIINDKTDRCNIMCSITANDKVQPTYFDDASSVVSRAISKNATTSALESLGATLNFINCWLKLFHNNYEVRSKMYHEAMKKLFKQIPTKKSKPLSHD